MKSRVTQILLHEKARLLLQYKKKITLDDGSIMRNHYYVFRYKNNYIVSINMHGLFSGSPQVLYFRSFSPDPLYINFQTVAEFVLHDLLNT